MHRDWTRTRQQYVRECGHVHRTMSERTDDLKALRALWIAFVIGLNKELHR